MIISDDDHLRIAEAVAEAERGTSGEIRCVLALETGHPVQTALIAGALAALSAPAAALLLGFRPDEAAAGLRGWTAAHGPADPALFAAAAYAALQAAVMTVVTGLWLIPGVRRVLTPGRLRDARVRAAAIAQFEALGLTHTRDRTGVLLYASLRDHRAEVLADSGIWRETAPEDWRPAAEALARAMAAGRPAEGFIEAAKMAGGLMKAKLPARADDRNEMPDGLILDR